ncbi:probable cation-transporting ATPase 13A4 isoform X2 [Engystomops pustulosus]|uniref:probable cation-transporting ATPase 13A4 isoform X2 n=1 Tax=Engystomops pustulosus TaxID=76066 RepID=UPI003AFA6AD2
MNCNHTDTRALLNPGEENEMELFGYRTLMWRQVLCIIGYIFSLGFLLLLFYFKPEWDVWCQCTPCGLQTANIILLRTTDDFKKYTKKKVFWVEPFKTTDIGFHEVISDQISLINKALIMPDYKVRCIRVQKIRYLWNALEGSFQKSGALEDDYTCSDIHTRFGSGFTQEEQEIRREICGLNTIEVEVTPIWKLLFKEVLNPFYFCQAFSLSLWFATGYIEFPSALVVITLLSMSATVYNMRMQSVKLHKMVSSNNSIKVAVLGKDGDIQELESQYLVPGDVIVLTGRRIYLPCDSLLLTGSCVVNEGMLTGESVPVTKTPLPNVDNSVPWKVHSGEDYKRHVLFCGTEVIQTQASQRSVVKAVVLRTGFNTAKGDLVRSILYPKPVNFKLHRDAIRFLLILVGVTMMGVIYTAVIYARNGTSAGNTILWSLVVLTVSISPALPAAVTVCILYSQTRLKRSGIFCLSAQRINMCGQLNIICFDKTGTLTEDGMELWGIVPSEGRCFQEVYCFIPNSSLPWSPLLAGMASCHSLIVLDGIIQGDPLDLKMFQSTDWVLQDTYKINNEDEESQSYKIVKPGTDSGKVPVEGLAILHQFPFSSSLQRMSVIVEVMGSDEFLVFMKGAPEMVEKFCAPETVPLNFDKELEHYTSQGFRVISLAYKKLSETIVEIKEGLERKRVESDLMFIGFLVMENKLKPETKPVLQELMEAKIRTVMITGDNLQTACKVGKASGMIPPGGKLIVIEASAPEESPASVTWGNSEEHQENGRISKDSCIKICDLENKGKNIYFAMTGKSYQVILNHFYELLPKILVNGTIFARMSPGQKSSLMEEFQKIDYYAGMCGDGANDCGALKMAHAGVSLSELEASVASPFTSKIPNIECVPKLIKEGRNCLVTSFCIFKYITMYSMIGIMCMLLLFWKQMILGSRQYLMQDVAITITVTLTMSFTGPAPKLAPYRPSGQLISPPLLLSVILQSIFSFIIQIIAFTVVQKQSWYNDTNVFSACPPLNHSVQNNTMDEGLSGYGNSMITTMWFISGMNLIIVEIVFCKGRPFRKPFYTNYVFTILVMAQLAAYLFIYFANIESVYRNMELVCTPYYWRWNTFIMLSVLFVVSYLVEEGFIENRRLWLLIKSCFNYRSSSQYRVLERALCNDPTWPPQGQTQYSHQKELTVEVQEHVYENPTFDAGAEKIVCNGTDHWLL